MFFAREVSVFPFSKKFGSVSDFDSSARVSSIFSIFAGLGSVVVVFWATAAGNTWKDAIALMAVVMVVAGAAAMLGGLTGFLFGIPRTLQGDPDQRTNDGETRQLTNTNLERVSDWLTTLLIGATLTQLTVLPGLIWKMSGKIEETITVSAVGLRGVVSGVFLYFLIVGFFSGYLLTRLFLALAFNDINKRLGRKDVQTVLSRTTGDAAPTDEELGAAKNIAQRPLESLTVVSDIEAWAKAQVILGSYQDAANAYKKLVVLAPDNPQFLIAYASVLDKLGQRATADSIRDSASKLIKRIGDEQTSRLEASQLLSKLYRPNEYDDVIKLAEARLKNNDRDAEAHFLLSVAYAQKYTALLEEAGKDPADIEVRAARDSALLHLRRSIELNTANKERGKMLWDPSYPNKAPSENDFEIFFKNGDKDFENTLK